MKATVQIHLASRDATVSCEFDDSQLKETIMSAFDDLATQVDGLDAAITELQDGLTAVVTAETAQVMAAIDALKAGSGSGGTPEQVAALSAKVDAVKNRLSSARDAITSAIQSVYEPESAEEPVNPDEPPPAPELPPVE
jgi:outer membrane murein-binding lipoprotein Lpp